jgi:hypothetical protein
MNEPNLGHVYAQNQWHQPVFIVGNNEFWSSLRDAIDKILDTEKAATIQVCTSDGESYSLHAIREDSAYFDESQGDSNQFWGSQAWAELKLPYTDKECHIGDNIDPATFYQKWVS